MNELQLVFDPEGTGHGLYTEAIDLTAIGRLSIRRASHIEFDDRDQRWCVTTPGGRHLFNSPTRGECLAWEQQHFNRHPDAPPTEGRPGAPNKGGA